MLLCTCKIVVREETLLLVQFGTTADVDFRIDDHVVVLPGNFEYFDLIVQTDEDQRPVVKYRQVVPMSRVVFKLLFGRAHHLNPDFKSHLHTWRKPKRSLSLVTKERKDNEELEIFTFPLLYFGTGGFVGSGGANVGRGVMAVVEGSVFVVAVLVTNTLPHVTKQIDSTYLSMTFECLQKNIASDVPQMKFRKRNVGNFGGDAADVHRRDEFQVLLRTLVNDAPSRTAVDPHREILFDREQLSHVGFAIGDHLVTVHGRGWIVANVVRDSDTAVEQLDGDMVAVLAVVEENPVFLRGREDDGHVEQMTKRKAYRFGWRFTFTSFNQNLVAVSSFVDSHLQDSIPLRTYLARRTTHCCWGCTHKIVTQVAHFVMKTKEPRSNRVGPFYTDVFIVSFQSDVLRPRGSTRPSCNLKGHSGPQKYKTHLLDKEDPSTCDLSKVQLTVERYNLKLDVHIRIFSNILSRGKTQKCFCKHKGILRNVLSEKDRAIEFDFLTSVESECLRCVSWILMKLGNSHKVDLTGLALTLRAKR
ncbi:hypothetical protein WN51_05692 [Melipona quadrifasciata]|uniref:Uncharacterized protein n=1 Tax=Melipona quadrifasciata TaxID=166423 RepID=A0A0M9AB89_9HYME|nr:hypothetical protein WN51_05692 [Melipona quadrifasciata]